LVHDMNTSRRDANLALNTPPSTGIPFWDMMLSFGKASQQALSSYTPQAGHAPRADHGTRSDRGAVQQTTSNVEVIPVGEETLNVGTRLVAGETTRVRRIVVETPVEQDVSLREERVVVERRKPTGANATATQGILTDTTVEMSDSFEVAEAWKSVRVTEEVVLRREVTERHETVRDTVRRDEVIVEQAKQGVPAPRREIEAAQQNGRGAAFSQPNGSEPAQLAADLKEVAERFDANAGQQAKALATLHETLDPEVGALKVDQAVKTEQKVASSQPLKTTAEQPKASGRPEASAGQNDKGNGAHKN